MAYCSVANLKEYLGITTSTDDGLLADLIASADRIIDTDTGRTFEAIEDSTRYFDAYADVVADTLYFDTDLCEITSITNGDGTSISVSHYVTEPRNRTPYFAIKLKASSSKQWVAASNGDGENAITVVGKWAYSASAPDDIVQASNRLAAYLYRQKDNANDLDRAIVAGNSTVLPSSLPSDLKQILRAYRKRL